MLPAVRGTGVSAIGRPFFASSATRRVRPVVRTSDPHSGDTGSTPVRAAARPSWGGSGTPRHGEVRWLEFLSGTGGERVRGHPLPVRNRAFAAQRERHRVQNPASARSTRAGGTEIDPEVDEGPGRDPGASGFESHRSHQTSLVQTQPSSIAARLFCFSCNGSSHDDIWRTCACLPVRSRTRVCCTDR